MKRSQIKQWARKAYKRGRGFARITFGNDGHMWGHYEPKAVLPVPLGHIKDCWIGEQEDGTIIFYNHGQRIHTFAPVTEEENASC